MSRAWCKECGRWLKPTRGIGFSGGLAIFVLAWLTCGLAFLALLLMPKRCSYCGSRKLSYNFKPKISPIHSYPELTRKRGKK